MLSHAISSEIEANIPYLRRYARAVTGSRARGDFLAEETLTWVVTGQLSLDAHLSAKVLLFRALQDLWRKNPHQNMEGLNSAEVAAHLHLAKLTPGSREALLLRSFENFTDLEIGEVMRVPPAHAAELISIARLDLAKAITGRVLLIEDEPAIAQEIENIVTAMGHSVIGAATNHRDAVRMAKLDGPDLILSDIQLAENTSGLEAVSEILAGGADTPVVYVTAYPEQLLTGAQSEPAFLVTKPYSVDQVRSAVSQAMFFSPRTR